MTAEVVWDPEKATKFYMSAQALRARADTYLEVINRLPNSSLAKREVSLDGEKMSVGEYALRMLGLADAHEVECELNGGPEAVRSHLKLMGLVSYAGDVPPVPDRAVSHGSNYRNLPA